MEDLAGFDRTPLKTHSCLAVHASSQETLPSNPSRGVNPLAPTFLQVLAERAGSDAIPATTGRETAVAGAQINNRNHQQPDKYYNELCKHMTVTSLKTKRSREDAPLEIRRGGRGLDPESRRLNYREGLKSTKPNFEPESFGDLRECSVVQVTKGS